MTTPNPGFWDETALTPFYELFFREPVFVDFYDHSGFANFGYWQNQPSNAAEASQQLVELVCSGLAAAQGDLLEVGCGQGASTAHLAQQGHFNSITAINIDPAQINQANQRDCDATFELMDAAQLNYSENRFDSLISVEAAFHFNTRQAFLAEAARVLKPGASLALSDLLMARGAPLTPPENHLVNGIEGYAQLLREAGFIDIHIADITQQTWRRYRREFTRFITHTPEHAMSPGGMRALYALNVNSAWAIRACLLVTARVGS